MRASEHIKIGDKPSALSEVSSPMPGCCLEGFRMPPVLVSGEDGGHSIWGVLAFERMHAQWALPAPSVLCSRRTSGE